MIKLRTMIPIVTALTLSAATLNSYDTARYTKENTELLDKKAKSDTFEKKGKMEKKYIIKIMLGVFGSIGTIFFLHAIKNPEEFKKYMLDKYNDDVSNENPNQ